MREANKKKRQVIEMTFCGPLTATCAQKLV